MNDNPTPAEAVDVERLEKVAEAFAAEQDRIRLADLAGEKLWVNRHVIDNWHHAMKPYAVLALLSRLRAAEQRAAELAAANAGLLSIVERFVALPSGAWHPERHAAEEAELVTEARAAIDAARRLFGSAR